jgi:hypothetical protein
MSDPDFPEAKSDEPTIYQIDFVKEQLSKITNEHRIITYSSIQFDYRNLVIDPPKENKPEWE